MKKAVVLLSAGLLVLSMCTLAGAGQVGNIRVVGEEKERGFALELQGEHITRQMHLEERATLAATSYTTEYEYDYRPPDPVSGDTGYIYRDEYANWAYLDLAGLEEIETIDRYFLKASYTTNLFEIYGKFGVGRLISKWEHYWMEGFLGSGGSYMDDWYYHDGEEWIFDYTDEWGWGEEYDFKKESPVELGLEQSDWGTFYGLGLKYIFYEKPDFRVAFDAQYAVQRNKQRGFFALGGSYREWYWEDEEGDESYGEVGFGARIDESETTEMHLALVLSGIMGKLSPYGGLKFSNMSTKYDGSMFVWVEYDGFYIEKTLDTFAYTMKQKDSFGMFAGADYHFTDRVTGKFEIRILDETALSTGLQIAM
ncbi:hypothetical protein IBX65_02430 [Candidatus Aerophobetes bacterium]|nr:hypothetical protein [Candidatus Aerophobetes bacterium]